MLLGVPSAIAIPQTTTHAMTNPTWPDDATRDKLVGEWFIHQRRGGHRTSTDDFITALTARWLIAGRVQPVSRYLDMGCGIGSVLLLTAHALRPVASLGVEAQAQSVALARRSVEELPDDRPEVVVRHGDIRALRRDEIGAFELITGSPPYMPIGTGVLPEDPQRRACRFELRGGIEDYAMAAGRLLAEGGVFVAVYQTRYGHRVRAAGDAADLRLLREVRFWMRDDAAEPFLSTFVFGRASDDAEAWSLELPERVTVRTAEGAWTPQYRAARSLMAVSHD